MRKLVLTAGCSLHPRMAAARRSSRFGYQRSHLSVLVSLIAAFGGGLPGNARTAGVAAAPTGGPVTVPTKWQVWRKANGYIKCTYGVSLPLSFVLFPSHPFSSNLELAATAAKSHPDVMRAMPCDHQAARGSSKELHSVPVPDRLDPGWKPLSGATINSDRTSLLGYRCRKDRKGHFIPVAVVQNVAGLPKKQCCAMTQDCSGKAVVRLGSHMRSPDAQLADFLSRHVCAQQEAVRNRASGSWILLASRAALYCRTSRSTRQLRRSPPARRRRNMCCESRASTTRCRRAAAPTIACLISTDVLHGQVECFTFKEIDPAAVLARIVRLRSTANSWRTASWFGTRRRTSRWCWT